MRRVAAGDEDGGRSAVRELLARRQEPAVGASDVVLAAHLTRERAAASGGHVDGSTLPSVTLRSFIRCVDICACARIFAAVSSAQPSFPGGGGGGGREAADGGEATFDGMFDGAAALGFRGLPGLRPSQVALASSAGGGSSTLPKVPAVPSSSRPTWPEMMATALTSRAP
eukprot:scaffold63669_cov60-Phaeocystis_antarctica.AAC.2